MNDSIYFDFIISSICEKHFLTKFTLAPSMQTLEILVLGGKKKKQNKKKTKKNKNKKN